MTSNHSLKAGKQEDKNGNPSNADSVWCRTQMTGRIYKAATEELRERGGGGGGGGETERERQRQCLCVCERERGGRACVCVCVRERGWVYV